MLALAIMIRNVRSVSGGLHETGGRARPKGVGRGVAEPYEVGTNTRNNVANRLKSRCARASCD